MKFVAVLCIVSLLGLSQADVCWRKLVDWDLVPGLMVLGPKKDERPNTFYFGEFGRDEDKCAAACMAEPDCFTYTLPFQGGAWIDMGEDPAWQGLCMGRSISPNVSFRFPDINAGVKIPCTVLPTGDVTLTVGSDGVEADSSSATLTSSPTTFTIKAPGNTGHDGTFSLSAADGSFLTARDSGVVLEAAGADDHAARSTFYAHPAGNGDGSFAFEVFDLYDEFLYVEAGVVTIAFDRTNFQFS